MSDILEKLGKVKDDQHSFENNNTKLEDYDRFDQRNINLSGQKQIQEILDSMSLAISMYKLDIIDHELSKAKLIVNNRDLIFKILVPLLTKVGQMIQKREITLAGEIAFNSLLKFHLGEVIYKSRKKNQAIEKIVVASPEGAVDEIPLLLLSLILITKNFEVVYLGNNVPASALVETISACGASSVLIYLGRSIEEDGEKLFKKYLEYISKKITSDKKLIAYKSKLVNDKIIDNTRYQVFESLKQVDDTLKF